MTTTPSRPVDTQPWLHQHGGELQAFGTVRHLPLALARDTRIYSCQRLNRLLAERVQTLGGVAVGDPRHVAEITQIPRSPNGVESVPAMLSRLLEAHETILIDSHDAAARIGDLGDDGTNDILVSEVIRTDELQAWFLAEHLVDTPLVRADGDHDEH
jgi:starvation-inducible DNA-binding protein